MLIAIGFILLAWGIADLSFGNELLVPALSDCVEEFFALFGEGFFWTAVLYTLLRTLGAFVLSFVLAGVVSNV